MEPWGNIVSRSIYVSGSLFTQFQRNGQARLKNPAGGRPRKGELPALRDHGKRLSADEVNRTFKAAMRVLGKSSAEVERISGHSTRVGAAQELRAADMTLLELMGSGGWKDAKMPARYTRKVVAIANDNRRSQASAWHDFFNASVADEPHE